MKWVEVVLFRIQQNNIRFIVGSTSNKYLFLEIANLEIATSETKGAKQEQKEFIEEEPSCSFFFWVKFPHCPQLSLGAAESSLLLLTDGVTQSSLPVAQDIINTSLPLCP